MDMFLNLDKTERIQLLQEATARYLGISARPRPKALKLIAPG